MTSFKTLGKALLLGTIVAVAACSGADEIASPGEGNIIVGGGGGGPSTPSGPSTGTPAASCPTGFTNVGTIANKRNCQLPPLITGLFTIANVADTIYSVSGRVDVGVDRGGDAANPVGTAGNLTIDPGVTIFGSAGLDYIVVNRGSQMNAVGTSTSPIVFTSKQSVEGTTTADSIGQWGGLVILGRANITNCPGATAAAQSSIYGTPACEATVEGTSALYGGNSNSDSSGILRYVRVMHSGFQILPNNELNGITLAGVGTGTTIDHVQVHNSSDDGIEWFGGTVNSKYIVLTGNDDDSMDCDQGFKGATQFVIVRQRTGGGDHVIECSMAALAAAQAAPSGETPNRLTNPVFANVTFIGRPGFNGDGDLHFNTGSQGRVYNSVATSANICLDFDGQVAQGTNVLFRSTFLTCPTSFDPDVDGAGVEEADLFAAGTNNNVAGGTSSLTNVFINGNNENGITATDYSTIASTELSTALKTFLTPVTYAGAVKDAADTWWQGWTCGLPGTPSC